MTYYNLFGSSNFLIIDRLLPEFDIRRLPIQISNILELIVSQIIFTIKKYRLF